MNNPTMKTYTRKRTGVIEKPFEKPVVVPELNDQEPANHAWADARFALDIMSEHALFFALLMPKELAEKEHAEAVAFSAQFADLYKRIDADGPPERSQIKTFVHGILEAIKPFIEYKARLGEAQKSGELRSLVWPLFFDHTRHEAERWTRRLEQLAMAEPEFERKEVVNFWGNIMEEHALFVAHLLDPSEYELIEKAYNTSRVFAELEDDVPVVSATAALFKEPATVFGSMIQNPETDAMMSAAKTMLDFKTETARDIEAARIKSIIDPRLADHVRREAHKFVDELKRAV
jgi:hypothetical protein